MEVDSDFEGDVESLEAQAFRGVFRIGYVDANSEATERTIERCRRLVFPPHEYILAHCQLRNSERLFRLDRIKEIVDSGTGEVLSEFAGSRYGHQFEPVTSVYAPGDDLLRASRFDLDILTFVASLSSKMRDSQVAMIADYLVREFGAADSTELPRLIKRHKVPGPEGFRQAVKCVPVKRSEALLAAAAAVLQKVKRTGDLDRGVLAMLEARKPFFGRHDQ